MRIVKLQTLLEVQRCFDLLRRAESSREPLASADYIACVRASGLLDYELAFALKDHDVYVSDGGGK